jgi:hypothetical protein
MRRTPQRNIAEETSSRRGDLNQSTKNIPIVLSDDALILPHPANPRGWEAAHLIG